MKLLDILIESSLSRVWQHIKNDKSFAVVSAFRGSNTPEQNMINHRKLKNDVRSKNLGYIEQKSGYTYTNPETGEEGTVQEMSLFIPKCDLTTALKLGNDYGQESIIYKDSKRFDLINCKDGSVMMSFKSGDRDTITFDPATLRYAYSQFLKGNAASRTNYAFKSLDEVNELAPPSRTESMVASKSGKLAKASWKRIL